MLTDQTIEVIEKINMDYINLKSGKVYLQGEKLIKLKNSGLCSIWAAINRRMQFRKIKQIHASYNLPMTEQLKMARLGNQDIKVVVYSCITGSYDDLESPYLFPNNIDYILYSNTVSCNGWIQKKIPKSIGDTYSDLLINRYIKFHPFEFFSANYDYAVYIDGNVVPISDLSILCEYVNENIGLAFHKHCSRNSIYEEKKACKALRKGNSKKIEKQIKRYESEGFPENYGMVEGNVFVVDLKNEIAKTVLRELWEELLKSESGRDQLAWPYVLWKKGIRTEAICTLGRNAYKNPKIRIKSHN